MQVNAGWALLYINISDTLNLGLRHYFACFAASAAIKEVVVTHFIPNIYAVIKAF